MNHKKHCNKNTQSKQDMSGKPNCFIKNLFGHSMTLTLLIIPHLPVKKVKSFRLSTRQISIFVLLNIIMIPSIFILTVSYHSIKQKFETNNKEYQTFIKEYQTLKTQNDKMGKRLDEYEIRDQEIKNKMIQLDEMKNQLIDIIQSDSMSSELNISAYNPSLASRGGVYYSPAKYGTSLFIDPTTKVNEPEKIDIVLTSLLQSVESRIDEYNNKKITEEEIKKEARIPSMLPTDGIITSKYGYRKNPFESGYEYHRAIDIANSKSTPIKASGDGTIVMAGRDTGGYGLVVKIDHQNGYLSIYGHNSELAVKDGDEVKRGQIIAYMGSTGRSTGNHCHFEVRYNGYPVNPMNIK